MVPSEATLYPLSARTYAAFQVEPIIPAPNVQLVGYCPLADVRLPLGHVRSWVPDFQITGAYVGNDPKAELLAVCLVVFGRPQPCEGSGLVQ